jgi:hypothetical protein
MRRTTLGSSIGLGAVLLVGTALCGTAAQASPITCKSTVVLAGGDGYVLDSKLGAGVCVQTVDAVFGDFKISDLPKGGRVAFNVTNFGTPLVGYHGISFNDNFVAGDTYTADYSVEILSGKNLFKEINGDFTQDDGTSTLLTTTTEAGKGSVDWTKTGASGTGPDMINFKPGFTELDVTNKLIDGGSVTAVANDAIENAPVAIKVGSAIPEPASMAVLAAACFGFAAIRRRKANDPSI